MNEFITVFDGHTPDTNILGVNVTGMELLEHEDLHRNLSARGYDFHMMSPDAEDVIAGRATRDEFYAVRPHLATTAVHMEVSPPIDQATLQILARTLRWLPELNEGSDRAYLQDHRTPEDTSVDPLTNIQNFITLNSYGS